MAARIVLFGATGYTGRLTAEALLRGGARPVLAGRDRGRLAALAEELAAGPGTSATSAAGKVVGPALDVATADVTDPRSVAALLEPGDVLISTVGPFLQLGEPAVQAALTAKASYLDSTGEPPFVRTVFQKYGPRAADGGAGLLPAFGYDYVPGNLAAGLALEQAGGATTDATRVDVGYFTTGPMTTGSMSGGTAASAAGILLEPGYAWRHGALTAARAAEKVRSFTLDGVRRSGISLAGSEHLALPRIAPQLDEVNVYLGWTGPLSRPVQVGSLLLEGVRRVPAAAAALRQSLTRLAPPAGSGPDAEARAGTGSLVVAQAFDEDDRLLAHVVLRGPNGYTLTGELLAWGARQALETPLAPGAHGPVDAFGLESLTKGCAEIGLVAD
jgi:short subunit dehydrogenase-like uncharacterized protein